jgi:hypothetical protein
MILVSTWMEPRVVHTSLYPLLALPAHDFTSTVHRLISIWLDKVRLGSLIKLGVHGDVRLGWWPRHVPMDGGERDMPSSRSSGEQWRPCPWP